jgi:hypothetical protein
MRNLTVGLTVLMLVGCTQRQRVQEMAASGPAVPSVPAPVPVEPAGEAGPLIVTPADGRTTHNPTYYGEVPLRRDALNPALIDDPAARLAAALDDASADNWSLANWADALTAPLQWGARSVLIPVRQVTGDPLLETVTTPPTESDDH